MTPRRNPACLIRFSMYVDTLIRPLHLPPCSLSYCLSLITIQCHKKLRKRAYREHFKSDLHRYNLKLKLKGVEPVTEEEFRLVDAEDFFLADLRG